MHKTIRLFSILPLLLLLPAISFVQSVFVRLPFYAGLDYYFCLQKAKQTHFVDRSLFYATFPIQKQAPRGSWKFELKVVYMVAILDLPLFKEPGDEDYYIERIYLARERTKARYSKKLNFIFVELPKFKKPIEELETNVDRWLFCLKNLARLNSRPLEVQGKIFERLFKLAEIKKITNTEMEYYQKSVSDYADVRDCMDCAREESREEGFEKGIEKGVEKGAISKSFEIAKNLLDLHISINKICADLRILCHLRSKNTTVC